MPAEALDRLGVELQRLAGMDLSQLRRRWRTVLGRPAPDTLAQSLMQRVLAYQLQASMLGDLDRETMRLLERIARGDADALAHPELPGTKPGTLLVREWQGELQRVMVLERGFAWNGQTFTSLSKVAVAITGTSWNGPRFFGLRQAPKKSRGRSEQGRAAA